MTFYQLEHDKHLELPSGKQLLEVPKDVIEQCSVEEGCFLTFRRLPRGKKKEYIRKIHACKRLNGLFHGNITFYALETDSIFAPLIIWDIAHTMNVGETIRFLGESVPEVTLQKEYYSESFELISKSKGELTFKKVSALPIEIDRGLDDWTFGIPVGPGDATILNAVVKRILELKCNKKEIILCGRPGENFKYWDQVKIVGEDITAPPVQISRKKNTIVQNSSYGNICILHDRVFLPSDFMEAMKAYGDDYSVTTFQIVYFDDYYNFSPHRYSDYGVMENENLSAGVSGISAKENSVTGFPFNPNIRYIVDQANSFFTQNPLRYSSRSYATGSLYIAKRTAMLRYPLNNDLKWEEFEDIEWAFRMAHIGIPHRINPNSMAQSILSRPLLLANTAKMLPNGKITSIFRLRWVLPVQKKPLFKCTEEMAWQKIMLFQSKYCPNLMITPQKMVGKNRLNLYLQLLNSSSVGLKETEIEMFLQDVENLLLLQTFPVSFLQYMKRHFMEYGNRAMPDLMNYFSIIRQLFLRPNGRLFMNDATDFGITKSFKVYAYSAITAVFFARENTQSFYNPKGLRGYYRAILRSTPYLDYFLEK